MERLARSFPIGRGKPSVESPPFELDATRQFMLPEAPPRRSRIRKVTDLLYLSVRHWPRAFVVGLLHSQEGVMAGLCNSPEIDERIEKGRVETDPALRHSIYREIEEIIAREALLIPLFHEQNYRFTHPGVRGLKLSLSLPEVRYDELYVVR